MYHILSVIIAEQQPYCNPQSKINYTFVTNYTRKMFPYFPFCIAKGKIASPFGLDDITFSLKKLYLTITVLLDNASALCYNILKITEEIRLCSDPKHS